MPDPRAIVLTAAGVLLAAVGTVAWWTDTGTEAGTDPGTDPAAATAPITGTGTVAPAEVVAPRPGAPTQVRIPALDVAAPVVPVTAPDRTLVPPDDPTQLGWWADGARPGAEVGSALIAGHTVHTGGGALDDLETLERGDTVVVRTDRGSVRYAVQRIRTYTKGRIATDASRLFSQEAPGRLVLITCEDWDGERFLSNVVVTARPTR